MIWLRFREWLSWQWHIGLADIGYGTAFGIVVMLLVFFAFWY